MTAVLAEIDPAYTARRSFGGAALRSPRGELGPGDIGGGGETEGDQLDRRVREAEGVGALMRGVECVEQRIAGRPVEVDRHRHRVLLASIAHVDVAGAGERIVPAFGVEIAFRLLA